VWLSIDGGLTWGSGPVFDANSSAEQDSVTSLVMDRHPSSYSSSTARLYAGVRHHIDPSVTAKSGGVYELEFENLHLNPVLSSSERVFGFCDEGNCTGCDESACVSGSFESGRVELAQDPVSHNVIYAAMEKENRLAAHSGTGNGVGAGLYRSEDSGATWEKLTLPGPSNACQSEHDYWEYVNGSPGYPDEVCDGDYCSVRNVCERNHYYGRGNVCFYALEMAVSQAGQLWVGGLGVWSRDKVTGHWTDWCEENIHVDQHAIEFVSDTAGREYVYIGNDGGVAFGDLDVANPKLLNLHAESTDTPSINHPLSITQFYPGAAQHSNGLDSLAVVGTQDNGTVRGFREGLGGSWLWEQILAWSDGARNQIAEDFDPWTRWFASKGQNSIFEITDDGSDFLVAELREADTYSFYPDFAVCQSNPLEIISTKGSDGMDKTVDGGDTWVPDDPQGTPLSSSVVFAQDSQDPCDTYFAGFADGTIWRKGWDQSDTPPSYKWKKVYQPGDGDAPRVVDLDLHPSPSSDSALFAVFAPHPADSDHSRLMRADQPFAGDHMTMTWTELDETKSGEQFFEDNPVNAVLVVSDTPAVVYAGTDHGVFRSDDAGETWGLMSGGHPETIVHDIEEVDGSVVSFTHGRGAWRLDIIESILVSAPSSGQTHVIHSKMEIQWEASIEEDDALVDIQLSRDGGDNYESLLLEPIPASNGQETWIVTGDPTDTAKIRISEAVSGQVFGTSTGVFSIVAEPYLVNTTADSVDANLSDNICLDAAGDCSLRAAIQQANAKPGTQTVAFAITSSGVPTIQPGSRLPVVSDSIVIDGGTQIRGGLVELDGSAAGASQGLYFTSDNNVVRGLVINRFSQAGIALFGDGGGGFSTIQGCRIGTDTTGKLALGNGGTGIRINNSSGNTIGGERTDQRNVLPGTPLASISMAQAKEPRSPGT
jgi:CSLREA domain-containing protein